MFFKIGIYFKLKQCYTLNMIKGALNSKVYCVKSDEELTKNYENFCEFLEMKKSLSRTLSLEDELGDEQLDYLKQQDYDFVKFAETGKKFLSNTNLRFYFVKDKKIISYVEIVSYFGNKNVILSAVYTLPSYRKKGFTLCGINKIKEYLFKNFKVEKIKLDIITESSKILFTKIGALTNKNEKNSGGQIKAVLLNPNQKYYKQILNDYISLSSYLIKHNCVIETGDEIEEIFKQ